MQKIFFYSVIFFSFTCQSAPILPMNKAFDALIDLIPFLTTEEKFKEKKNERTIEKGLQDLDDSFKVAKHDKLLKQDIFAPSLQIIREEISSSKGAFKQGKKDYAWWRMRSITSQCLACHTRLPAEHTSSFQDGSRLIDKTKFNEPYNLGLAQLIVRQYPQAKESFTRSIDDSIIRKQFKTALLPLKQLVLVQTKIMKDPEQMLSILKFYSEKPGFSADDKETMKSWISRLEVWSSGPFKKWRKLNGDSDAEEFMAQVMAPLFEKNNLYIGKHDVDLLMAQGLLSNFLFENPESKKAPDVLYWTGIAEKYLERESFFGRGELFLKECVQRYPKAPIAKKCFEEYKESMEFNFTGSGGTILPPELEDELKRMKILIKP